MRPKPILLRFAKNLLFLFLICLALQVTDGQDISQKKASEAVVLELGKPTERSFPGGLDTYGYRINLVAGQCVRVIVEQQEVDVVAELFAPNGNLITRFDRELRLGHSENIEFVTESSGEFQLDVKTKFKSASGRFEIRFAELHLATESERLLFEANVADVKGNALTLVGKYAEAAPLTNRAVEIVEKLSGPDIGHFLNDLGYLQRQQGAYTAAETTLQRALELNEKTLGLGHPETIESIQNLGLVYRSQHDFAKADKMYRQSLALTERTLGAQHPKMVQRLISLETLLSDLGDAEQAEKVLQQALTIAEKHYEPDSLTITNILNNLGAGYVDDGKYDLAEPYFRRVLASYERTIGTENDRYSNTLQNLGIVLRHRKDFAQALQVYQRALAIREKSLGNEHLYLAPLLNNIANTYYALGDTAHAMETQLRSLYIAEKKGGAHNGYTIISLGNIARYYTGMHDAINALAFQTLAEERTETALTMDLAIGSERLKLIQLDAMSEKTSRTISLNVNIAPDNQQASSLAALVILQRKGRVLDAMSDAYAALRKRSNAEDTKLLDGWNSISAQLAKITLKKSPDTPLEEQRKQIIDLTEKKEKIEADISLHSEEFRAASLPVTLDAVRAEIPSDGALIEFALYRPYNAKAANSDEAYGEPRYIAYILRHDGDIKWKDLGNRMTIDADIEEWRRALGDPKSRNASTLGRNLDAKIMQPVRSALANAKHIFISPDGELNLIPFEALVDEKKQYLVENYLFTYLTSGRDLLRLKVNRESRSQPLVIANPQFGQAVADEAVAGLTKGGKTSITKRRSVTATRSISDTYFAPLAGTTREVREIQTLFPDSTLLSGVEATETALKRATAPRILHIATHGFFLEDESARDDKLKTANSGTKPPATAGSMLVTGVNKEVETQNPLLRSGLAFAGANRRSSTNGDDGILTALEASGLNLWGTKLVVLSACDTGLGEIKNGEGVYGLRRAFTLAGAETLMMSLWPISDYSTRELMTNYYKNLKVGMGRGESLRRSQLSMFRTKGREHPFYWAPFIQTGEWASLDGNR